MLVVVVQVRQTWNRIPSEPISSDNTESHFSAAWKPPIDYAFCEKVKRIRGIIKLSFISSITNNVSGPMESSIVFLSDHFFRNILHVLYVHTKVVAVFLWPNIVTWEAQKPYWLDSCDSCSWDSSSPWKDSRVENTDDFVRIIFQTYLLNLQLLSMFQKL